MPHAATDGPLHAQRKKRRPRSEEPRRSDTVRRAFQAPRLMVGGATDTAERDADLVADQVIARLRGLDAPDAEAAPEPNRLQRSAADPDAGAIVGAEGGAVPGDLSARIESARGGGSALPGTTRARMESAFGGDLGSVRIHDDAESAQLNRAVSARAFTLGNDIFFGRGEYRPDSPSGERVLAHELAHTQQGGGLHRQVIHRWWDFRQKSLDVRNRTRSIRTLSTRPVWFLSDEEGDEMVVKLENQPIGLAQLAGEMHHSISVSRSVLQRKLTPTEFSDVLGMIEDDQIATGPSWAAYGAQARFKVPGLDAKSMDPEEYGRGVASYRIRNGNRENMLAMTMAPGKSAEELAKPDSGDPGVSRFRAILDDLKHVRKLGEVTAVDLFLGNQDRLVAGNLGNWIYDSNGSLTLIDHVDSGTGMAAGFKPTNKKKWKEEGNRQAGEMLAKSQLQSTANHIVQNLAEAMEHMSKDDSAVEWMNSKGPDGRSRGIAISEALREGMEDGRKRVIKVFTATKFKLWRRDSRKLKKSLKGTARQASEDDQGSSQFDNEQVDYYQVLKSRAEWLKKH